MIEMPPLLMFEPAAHCCAGSMDYDHMHLCLIWMIECGECAWVCMGDWAEQPVHGHVMRAGSP
jgi:hypothetical protein